MKKTLILLAIAIATLASCSKIPDQVGDDEKQIPDRVGHDEVVITRTVTFTATVEQDADSKASINSSGFSWQKTDEVAVMTAKGQKITLTPTDRDGASATFTATIDADDSIDDGAIVVFPARFMNDAGQIVFPSSHANLSTALGPFLAAEVQASRSTLAFKYFAGAMRIHITDLPRYTSAIVVNTKTSDGSSDVVSTGTFSIAFSGSGESRVPTLSSVSTGNTITINNGSHASGSQSFVLPIPTAGEQKVTFYFKQGDNVLREISTTKTFARNTFLSMADLTLVNGVYFKSDWTNWDEDETGAMTAGAGFTYTAPDYAFTPATEGDSARFKYYVKFGEHYVPFGPNSNTYVVTSGANYNWGINNSCYASLNQAGVYSFTYNSATGQFSVGRQSE